MNDRPKARRFSAKQIRYLWAIGFLKSSPHYKGPKTAAKALKEGKKQTRAVKGDTAPASLYPEHDAFLKRVGGHADLSADTPENTAVKKYLGPSGFRAMNDLLRGSVEDDDADALSGTNTRKLIADMDKAFDKHGVTLKQEETVYRGISGPGIIDQLTGDGLFKRGEGSSGQIVLEEAGYTSTATSRKMAEYFSTISSSGQSEDADMRAILTIKLPKGSRGIPMPNETEFLIPRQQEYVIHSVQQAREGHYEIELELYVRPS